jgi:hypothetical protein
MESKGALTIQPVGKRFLADRKKKAQQLARLYWSVGGHEIALEEV